MRSKAVSSLCALVSLVSIVSLTSIGRADDAKCEGWFCADQKEVENVGDSPAEAAPAEYAGLTAGTPVEIDLQNGGAVHGVVVSLDATGVVVRAGDVLITIKWTEIAGLRITVQAGPPSAPSAQPAPAPPAVIETAPPPAEPPPPVIEAAPPPPKKRSKRSAMFIPSEPERDLLFLDMRVKMLAPLEGSTFRAGSALMSEFLPLGGAWELGMSLGLSRNWRLRGFYESAAFGSGDANASHDRTASSRLLGVGLMGTTASDAEGVSALLELGLGYRWLSVPYGAGRAPDGIDRGGRAGEVMYEGLASLRLAAGLTFALSQAARLHTLGEVTFGRFSQQTDPSLQCAETRCDSIGSRDQTPHAFAGLTIGLELGAR
ncbi:MAG: hypothetical protein HYV09_27410 [Deltaproteobacteria bacterium]|nr:hypothetical protein [Deltaproteobacteria bacterium]